MSTVLTKPVPAANWQMKLTNSRTGHNVMNEELSASYAYNRVSEEEKKIGLEIEKLLVGLSISSAQYLLKCVSDAVAEKNKVSST